MSARRTSALLLLGSLAAQPDVFVHLVLPDAVAEIVGTRLERQLAEQAILHVTRREARDLVADLRARSGVVPVDVVFGLDAHWLAQLAGEGLLEPYASPRAATLRAEYRSGDRFVVPFVSPFQLACDRRKWSSASAPRDHDALQYESAFRGELVLCEPRAQPALFAGWMQRELRRAGEEHALAWLRTLDAQVREYLPSPRAALAALEAGRGSLAIVPLCDLAARAVPEVAPIAHQDLAPGLPWLGLGLALGKGGGGEARAAAAAVYDELASKELALALGAATGLWASPRTDGAESSPAGFDANVESLERWLQLWENDVRGRGAASFTIATVLDLVFAAAFLAFLWFVYRRTRGEP